MKRFFWLTSVPVNGGVKPTALVSLDAITSITCDGDAPNVRLDGGTEYRQ